MLIILFFMSFSLKLISLEIDEPRCKPTYITLKAPILTTLNLPIKKKTYFKDLALTSWENLTHKDYSYLNDHLSNKRIKLKPCHQHTNALAVLILYLSMYKKNLEIAHLISFANDDVFLFLKKQNKNIITSEIIANSIKIILIQEKDANELINKISSLIYKYTRFCLDYSQIQFKEFLSQILSMSDVNLNNKEKGIILGSILSGALTTLQKMEDDQARSLLIVDSMTNIFWAAGVFLETSPLVSAIVYMFAGSFSLGVVILELIHKKINDEDIGGAIREIEGQMEIFLLDKAKNDTNKRLDVLEILAWMRAAIHINGFND